MTREDWLGSYRSGVKLIVRNDPIEEKVSAFREEAPKLAFRPDSMVWYDESLIFLKQELILAKRNEGKEKFSRRIIFRSTGYKMLMPKMTR